MQGKAPQRVRRQELSSFFEECFLPMQIVERGGWCRNLAPKLPFLAGLAASGGTLVGFMLETG